MTTLKHDPDEGCGGCPLYGDEFDVCQAERDEHPDGRATGTNALTSPNNPSPPAPEWCPLRLGPVGVVPPWWRDPEVERIRDLADGLYCGPADREDRCLYAVNVLLDRLAKVGG